MDARLFGLIIAFLLALLLFYVVYVLWRRFGSRALSSASPRIRQPRLAVLDAAVVDSRRRLVLIRCDSTEHLLMIGGPTDIVIEPNVARAAGNGGAREVRPVAFGELPPRQPALDDPSWPGLTDTLPRLARTADAAEAVLHEPLRAEPVRQGPARQDPLREDPVRQEPLRQEPLRQDPLREPLRQEPLRQEPLRQDPLREPLRQEPLRQEPLQEPLRQEPLRQEPLRQEPLRQEPLRQEPLRQDLLRQDPMRIEPVRPEPPRLPREPMAAQYTPTPPFEPGMRSAPPGSAEQFGPDFDHEAQAVPASMPLEPAFYPAGAPQPKRVPAPPPALPESPAPPAPTAPTYEAAFQTAPGPVPRWQAPSASPLVEPVPPSPGPRVEQRTAPPRPSQTDKNNLAEMAQRLEAALRRPIRPVEPVPTAPPARAIPRFEPSAPQSTPSSRLAAAFETAATPAPPTSTARPTTPATSAMPTPETGAASVTGPQAPARPQKPLAPAGLEAEIANLLGRPPEGT